MLTNSLWDYTHVVMNFLCGKTKREERTTEWLDLFDVAITGACKVNIWLDRRFIFFLTAWWNGLFLFDCSSEAEIGVD